MRISTQKMSIHDFEKTDVYKNISKHLKEFNIDSIDNNDNRIYKHPSTSENCIIYDFNLSVGSYLRTFVAKDGRVVRFELKGKIIASTSKKGEEIDTTEAEVAKFVIKQLKAENQNHFKVKINKGNMNKLLDEISKEESEEDKEEIARLERLKVNLTKGSGKYIVLKEGEFVSNDGSLSKNQSDIRVFDTLEDAKEYKLDNKTIVKV